MDERVLKLKELLKDEDFVKAFLTKEEPEDAQAFLEENGIEFSLDEIHEISAAYQKFADGTLSIDEFEKAANGELSEDELEEIAGGTAVTTTVGTAALVIAEVVIGYGALGAGIGAIVKYKDELYNYFRRW